MTTRQGLTPTTLALGQVLTPRRPAGCLRAIALAIAALGLAASAAHADVVATGANWLDPALTAVPPGPGNLNLPAQTLWTGGGSVGSFSVLAGSRVDLASWRLGAGGATGNGLIDGAGTVLALHGNGDSARLEVGNYGSASLAVSGGALLDGRASTSACEMGLRFCGSQVGASAGSTGLLTVTGAGSSALLMGGLSVANGSIDDRFDFGRPGATSRGRVEVLAGGALTVGTVGVGQVYPSPFGGNGGERSFAEVLIAGSGSRWTVDGGSLVGEAAFNIGVNARADGQVKLRDGGQLLLAPTVAGQTAVLWVGHGGTATLDVSGAGSSVTLQAAPERATVRIAEGGSGSFVLAAGASLSGFHELSIGLNGGVGQLALWSGARATGASRTSFVVVGDGDGAGQGILSIDGGSQLQAGRLEIGLSPASRGDVQLTGSGSRLELGGLVGNHRLYLGNGDITVSGGGLLSTRTNEADCAGDIWCATLIGGYAGADASLTVSGANSKASFTGHFQAGIAGLATQAADGWTQGTPGGQTLASIRVLDGGVLQTDHVSLGLGTFSEGATGDESAIVNVLVSGAGSRWEVSGGNNAAYFNTQVWNAKNSLVAININNGGHLLLAGPNGSGSYLNLSSLPGITTLAIKGAGSELDFAPASLEQGALNLLYAARSSGAIVDIAVSQGGRISGVNYLSLGERGGVAALRLDGTGSQYISANDTASVRVGRNDGQGILNVSGGAQMLLHSQLTSFIVGLNGGQGTAQLAGAGSLLSLKGLDDGTGTGSAQAYVGYNGGGSLNIKSGAQLRIESAAPAMAEQYWRGAGLTVGLGDGAVAQGQVNVTGTGSRIDVLGVNPFITVGEGALGSGQMTISDGAAVRTSLMGVGYWGATGSVRIDNASLALDGAWRSGVTIGASLAVGSGTGSIGTLALSNGARLEISNSGTERTSLSLGGLDAVPGGSGVLTVSGGSSVAVGGAGGGQFLVGATASGVGIATISGGSSVSASYVGVGALYGADAGIASLLVQDSSRVTAATIEIGAKGFVGGTGTLVGNIINRGIFSPGNSPGTLVIDGSFSNQAGGRLVLEVEADGHGGFNTDHLVFSDASLVDLAGLQISFRFLGSTNPNAFQSQGGFKIDNFFDLKGGGELSHDKFAGVSYTATADTYQLRNFSFSADAGAVFSATPVPEPSEWLLMLAGLGLVMFVARRRLRG